MPDETRQYNDPSANVQQLVGNAVKYLESLQKSMEQNFDEKLKSFIETSRRERDFESNRIDELRKGDIEAVKVANVQAVKTAELLNATMLENAEVLRKAVEATALAVSNSLRDIVVQQDTRFQKLEQAQWENQGKSVATPDLQTMVTDLVNTKYKAEGRSSAFNPVFGLLYVVAGGVVTFLILQAIGG